MSNEPVDFNAYSGDTKSNNVDNNGLVEVIRREELQPLNDPNCEHSFKLDGEIIGNTRAWVCVRCHRGVFLPKHITKII